MVDATTAIISAVFAGLAGGFLNSWLAFNASGETFNARKHGNALIVGALTGMALGLSLVIAGEVVNKGDIPPPVFALGVFFIFLAAAGVDTFRSKASKMIAKHEEEQQGGAGSTTTTAPPPTPPTSPATTTTTTKTEAPKST
jgi:hypothetical protein